MSAASQDALSMVGEKLGNLRLISILGRGRMGVVYRAHDEALQRPTAVKIMAWEIPHQQGQDPQVWFLAEARSMARINHPHVVQIYGIAKHRGRCYISMEFVDGAAADAWIDRDGPFRDERATAILAQSASALHAAHAHKVVHSDVKPGNLLVTADGAVKLADFGMARLITAEKVAFPVRTGTPFYTAPEIWRGEPSTPATDVYALGATYFHLLTGRPPFEARDLATLRAAHLNAELPDVQAFNPRIPLACGHIVQRCLAKSARDRYASAEAVRSDAAQLMRT